MVVLSVEIDWFGGMQGLLKREQGLQKLHINSSIDHPDRVERGVLRAAGMVERSVDTVTRVTSTEVCDISSFFNFRNR